MAYPTVLIPQPWVADGRYVASPYDGSGNLLAWPATKNGPYDLSQRTGWTSASKTVTGGDAIAAIGDPIIVTYNLGVNGTDVWWALIAGTATTIPDFLTKILTNAGYTIA